MNGAGEQEHQLRIRGQLYWELVELVDQRLDAGDELDIEIADQLSRVGIKAKGRGHQVFIRLTATQIERLSSWLPEDGTSFQRQGRAGLVELADEARAREQAKPAP